MANYYRSFIHSFRNSKVTLDAITFPFPTLRVWAWSWFSFPLGKLRFFLSNSKRIKTSIEKCNKLSLWKCETQQLEAFNCSSSQNRILSSKNLLKIQRKFADTWSINHSRAQNKCRLITPSIFSLQLTFDIVIIDIICLLSAWRFIVCRFVQISLNPLKFLRLKISIWAYSIFCRRIHSEWPSFQANKSMNGVNYWIVCECPTKKKNWTPLIF